MSETETETPVEAPPPDEPDEQPDDDDEIDLADEGTEPPSLEVRCDAAKTVRGQLYRCALYRDHAGEHAYQEWAGDEGDAEFTTGQRAKGDADFAKAAQRLEAEAERHAKRVREIMGDDSNSLVQCELCPPNIPGWRFDVVPSKETTDRVRVAIGLPDMSNFRPSPNEATCQDCGGLGMVKTGSSVQGRETKKCDPCDGNGYVTTRTRTHDDASPPLAAENGGGPVPQWDDGVQRDMFGTPITDPDYGKMPGMRARPVDYWQTNRV